MSGKMMDAREDLEYILVNELAEPKHLPYLLLEEITNNFTEVIGTGGSAAVYKGYIGNHMVAVKKMFLDGTQIELFDQEIEILMRVKHKNVVRFLGYCSDAQEFFKPNQKVRKSKIQERFTVKSKTQERLLCFEYLPATLYDYTKDAPRGFIWRQCYQIIVGICLGLHQLHEDNIIHGDLKPQNILMDDDQLPKLADFGLSKCLDVVQVVQPQVSTKDKRKINYSRGYMAPEELKGDDKSKKSDLYSLGRIIRFILQAWPEVIDNSQTEAELEQIKVCNWIWTECIKDDPTNRPDTRRILARLGDQTGRTQETQKGLHVEPKLLVFVLGSQRPGKLIPCLLQLTNDTDQHMSFKLSTTQSVDWSEHFMRRLPLYGIVPARSTYTLILTVSEWKVPTERNCNMILQSCTSRHDHITKFKDTQEFEKYFGDYKAANKVQEVPLKAFLSKAGRPTSFEKTEPRVRILSLEKQSNNLHSVDAHPIKPWRVQSSREENTPFLFANICSSAEIITGHDFGHVRIWNHETKILLNSFKVSQGPVYSVKFIARKHWFICGSAEGLIHVYSYEREMQKMTSFKAHDGLMSLAVHPTQPYVLSWPCSHRHRKKLWDWEKEKEWKCTQTFEEEIFAGDLVCHVAFDTKDTNRYRFASTCGGTVKVWTLDSGKCEYALPGYFYQVNFLEFFTRDDRQYLITGSHDMTAKIWDMQTKKYVPNELQTSVPPVASVFSHPNLPILLTCSSDGTSHFWSSKDFRLEAVLDYGHGGVVRGIACLMGSKRKASCLYVIGQEATITILDIANGKYENDSVESSEAPLYTDTRQEERSSEAITQGSNTLLHIQPMKLHLPFQAHKVNMCSLHLTNKTYAHVAFRLGTEEGLEWSQHPFGRMPLCGIVPSRSTYTLVLITRELPYLHRQRFNLILQSSISGDRYKYTFKDQSECDLFFEDAKETGNGVHELTLEVVLSLQGLAMSEDGSTGEDLIQPSVNIWGLFHPAKAGSGMVFSLDADPRESWLLTGHGHGNVSLWECGTQRMMSSINACEETRVPCNSLNTHLDVYSIKFITRERWFVAGTYDGFVHVYNYGTTMYPIGKVKVPASGIRQRDIYSSRALVIHPTKSYVLSTFEEMKLLDWQNKWKCKQTFNSEHKEGSVRQVAFNPKDTSTFASASSDHTIKLWRLDSSKSEYTLRGHLDKVNCLGFFTSNAQQYLISGSQDCTARIWDLKERNCVHTADVFMSPVISVTSLPDASYLTTGSEDGTIHLWSCASISASFSLKLERIFNIGCGGPVQSLCLMGSKRVVIQQEGEISIMDIDKNSETSVSALPNELIQVEPPELRFPAVQEVSSQLKISNITSHHVAFSTWSTRNKATYSTLPDRGVLSPKSTLQVVVTREAHKLVPEYLMHEDAFFLHSIIVDVDSQTEDVTDVMFEPNTDRSVQEVKLAIVVVASEIISKVSLPWTLDVHPTEPWIMTTQGDYHVHIWNYESRKTKSIAIKGREVTSAKFIARKEWIVAGCSSGVIYVYSYKPMKKKKVEKVIKQVEKIHGLPQDSESVNSCAVHTTRPAPIMEKQVEKIEVGQQHSESDKSLAVHTTRPDPIIIKQVEKIKVLRQHSVSVNSLAVHTTKPYVLSASKDGEILIWDYENDWKSTTIVHAKSPSKEYVEFINYGNDRKLIKKVGAKSLSVEQVAFPKETDMFASAQDKTVKIWDLGSGKCKHILSEHSDLVVCLDYFSLGGKLHLITGSQDKTAKIWDCETEKCVQTLEGHMDVVKIACCHPDLQILITGSRDGSVRLWDSNTFRHERTLKLDLGEVYAIASLKGSTRIAIANEKGLALVDIGLRELIKVDPLQLRFPIGKNATRKLKICNITDYCVAFIVYNNHINCTIWPDRGILSPQSKLDVDVRFSLQENCKSFKPNEVLTVKSTVVEKNLKTTEVTYAMFKTEMCQNVHHMKMVVVFS